MAPAELTRACPVCRNTTCSDLLRKESLQLVRCQRCSMVYASPIDEGWANGSFYDQLGRPYYLSAEKVDSDYSPVRFERELKLFRRFCAQGNVLDVGCSTGAFLFQLKNRHEGAYEVLGADVSGSAVDYAEKKGIPVLRDSFLTHDFGPKQFSAITIWAVLEHLAEPAKFLDRASSILEPGGLCFVLVPNFQSLAHQFLGRKYRYIFPQHINYFTQDTLKRLAGNTPSLRIVHTTFTHFNPLVLWQDWRGTGEFVPDEERARLLKQTTGYKNNPLLKPAKLALSVVESVLAAFGLADNLVIVLRKGS
jgi:2-polyprenyl-3-methyl-5-hydroxy-6-metoxy-1,4-benzoquinol methylase